MITFFKNIFDLKKFLMDIYYYINIIFFACGSKISMGDQDTVVSP